MEITILYSPTCIVQLSFSYRMVLGLNLTLRSVHWFMFLLQGLQLFITMAPLCFLPFQQFSHWLFHLFFFTYLAFSFREGNSTPLQYSCLENPTDRGAWRAAVHGVTGSRTRLSDFTFTFHFHALEKEMATHSSVLAWRIPGTGEPGGLPSLGSHRVGHDWSDLAAAAAATFSLLFCLFSMVLPTLPIKSILPLILYNSVCYF